MARRAHRNQVAQGVWSTGGPVVRVPIPRAQAARAARSLVITDLHSAFAPPSCALVQLQTNSLADGHNDLLLNAYTQRCRPYAPQNARVTLIGAFCFIQGSQARGLGQQPFSESQAELPQQKQRHPDSPLAPEGAPRDRNPGAASLG
jgi:hypothetical protein